MAERIQSYDEFWPFYLSQHSHPANRALHITGTGLGVVFLVAGIATFDGRLVVASVILGYAFAWAGHALIERNKLATFTYPVWSLVSDFRMFGLALTGRLAAELKRQDFG